MQEVSGGGNTGQPGEDVIEVSSTPLEVRQLHGTSRCIACQTEDRICYVAQRSSQCLKCRSPADCHFRRTVERSLDALSWAELTGTVAGQKRPLEDNDSSMDRKLRPIDLNRSAIPHTMDRPVNGRVNHEMPAAGRGGPGWPLPIDNRNARPPFPPVHIKPLNLEPSDHRMVSRRIPVTLPAVPVIQPLQHHSPPAAAPPVPLKREIPEANPANHKTSSPRTDATPLYCEQCQVHFSTNSEYSKHRSRHTKRFRCDVQGCKKIDGFATLNDLDRHKKSVHSVHGLEDPVWRCFVDGCKSRDKIWPRQDNFRAHLERMHRGVDVEQYVKISDKWLEEEERPKRIAARRKSLGTNPAGTASNSTAASLISATTTSAYASAPEKQDAGAPAVAVQNPDDSKCSSGVNGVGHGIAASPAGPAIGTPTREERSSSMRQLRPAAAASSAS